MWRRPEQPRIDFVQHPELYKSLGSATVQEMIRELPHATSDPRSPEAIARDGEARFVRGWYRGAGSGLLTRTVALSYVMDFGLAPDISGARSLLHNTALTEGASSLDEYSRAREFPGCLARARDIFNIPTDYHLFVRQKGQEGEAFVMRPAYSAA